MVDILLTDDNIYYTKTLINSISEKNKCTRVFAIATNGKEVLEKIEQNKIDIILLDIEMPQYNGFEVLNILSQRYRDYYRNSVIVMSNYYNNYSKFQNNPCVYSCANKINGIDNILNEIQKLVEIKEKDKYQRNLKKDVMKELAELNYNFKYNGTKYLIESIMLIWNRQDIDNINLKRDIFPVVAKNNNKTISNVKININYANEMMFYDCPQYKLDQYFGYKVISKPKVKFVISTILQKLYINK